MKDYSNPKCRSCARSRKTINGLYCTHLSQKVEYKVLPPCESTKTLTI